MAQVRGLQNHPIHSLLQQSRVDRPQSLRSIGHQTHARISTGSGSNSSITEPDHKIWRIHEHHYPISASDTKINDEVSHTPTTSTTTADVTQSTL